MVCPEDNLTLPEFLDRVGMDADRYRLALRSGVIRPNVSLRRSVKDRMINGCNGNLLKLWQANLDVQFILNSYAAAMYVASYIMKTQKGMTNMNRPSCWSCEGRGWQFPQHS